MTMASELLDELRDREESGRIYGVVSAVVTNNNDDPGALGRVKVRYPWLGKDAAGYWARVAAPMAGKDRGVYFLPDVDDEVLVAFEQGDVRFPYVIGALWNGKDTQPAKNDNGKNSVHVIKTRSGHVIRLTDDDKAKIEVIDSKGNSIVIDTDNNSITIKSNKDISLSAPDGVIKLDAQKIEIKSSADAKIESGAGMDVKASGAMNVKGATVNIN
jgi:uncharacterized protein involved in type VI secretion and phage assembly